MSQSAHDREGGASGHFKVRETRISIVEEFGIFLRYA
jgi:hypothetical protein